MKRDYFGKNEQIGEGGKAMIIMDIKADNLYAFRDFHMNMSYPKKIVGSTVVGEYLPDRTNFRYKKLNIIMGGNATGKTTIGKLMMLFANYINDMATDRFIDIVDDKNVPASLQIDFVTLENKLYRYKLLITPQEKKDRPSVSTELFYVKINKEDNYEMCAKKLDLDMGIPAETEEILINGWLFSYPQDAWKDTKHVPFGDEKKYTYVLEKVLKTLDPAINDVIKVQEVENTYAIRSNNKTVIVQDGKVSETSILSSGTKAGIDIAYIMASLAKGDMHDLYYCDERFSYVNSDIEKACLSIMIDKLSDRKQLFFTTHNTDVLDMQLPKHSFTFLKKENEEKGYVIKCISADKFLKRNSDSLKNAVENDLFCTAPNLDDLYSIAEI